MTFRKACDIRSSALKDCFDEETCQRLYQMGITHFFMLMDQMPWKFMKMKARNGDPIFKKIYNFCTYQNLESKWGTYTDDN